MRKAKYQRTDTFKFWCWRRLLRVSWTTRTSNQSILKDINSEYSLERLLLKLQYFDHLIRRANSLELLCWRRVLRVPWTARRSNQFILKEISPEYLSEGLMLKLKLQYFGHLMQRTDSFERDSNAGKDWRQEEKGTTEDKIVGWYHRLNGHEFGWTLGVGDGQGDLACWGLCACKESDTIEQLNWTELNISLSGYTTVYSSILLKLST